MKKKAHFSNLIYVLLALTLHTAFSSPVQDAEFFIELPEAFLQTLQQRKDGKFELWHPRLTVTKVERSPVPHKSAQMEKDNGFLSFMQVGAGAKAGESNVVVFPNQEGISLLKSSKMNCECRFIKDATAQTQVPTLPKGGSFVEKGSKISTSHREELLGGDSKHKASPAFIEKPKEDEVAEMLAQMETKLDRQAKEVEEREHKQARAHDLESSDEDMKKQLLKLIQEKQASLIEKSESSTEMDKEDLMNILFEMESKSESGNELFSDSNDDEKMMDMEDFSKFVQMYNAYQDFQTGKLTTNKKSKNQRKQMLVELKSEGSEDDRAKLAKLIKSLEKQGIDKKTLKKLIS